MQYVASSGEVTLAATVAKTVLMLKSTAAISAQIVEIGVSFNGTNAEREPVIVELVKCTLAGVGTFTAGTPVQVRGNTNTGGSGTAATITSGSNYTVEPTVVLETKSWFVSPTSGLFYPVPLGRETEVPQAASPFIGIGLRMKAKDEVKVRAYLEFVQGPS